MDEILPPGCLRQTAQTSAVDCDCGPPLPALKIFCLREGWKRAGVFIFGGQMDKKGAGEELRGKGRERWAERGEARDGCRHGNGGETKPGEMCRQRANDDELPPTQPIRGKCKNVPEDAAAPAGDACPLEESRALSDHSGKSFTSFTRLRQRGSDTRRVAPRA